MSHIPRKRFGQNFLTDQRIIYNILTAIQCQPGQHWVEIGPGQGALTEPLLETGVRLDVVELDRDLVALLRRKFARFENLRIHGGDALNFNFDALAAEDERLRIIGNLPYNISTPLLFHLMTFAPNIADMHFMLQKEVVDRICASPGSKKYGRLSIMLQYYCETLHLFDVPAESFAPRPKVISAIVKLIPYRNPPVKVDNMDDFNKVVAQAFSQRRKTLKNSLKVLIEEDEIVRLNIDPNARAETLSISEFADLSNLLTAKKS